MMPAIVENILIMILTIAVLLGGGYLLLVIVGWGLKIKSGGREQEGLTDLWIASQTAKPEQETTDDKPQINRHNG
jgi:hypothetical protein